MKPLAFDRNIIAVQPANDHAAPVMIKPLDASSKRHHQGIAPRSNNHRAGLANVEEEPETPPERVLWLAVIAQALDEAKGGRPQYEPVAGAR